jgi:hypothetical protein
VPGDLAARLNGPHPDAAELRRVRRENDPIALDGREWVFGTRRGETDKEHQT